MNRSWGSRQGRNNWRIKTQPRNMFPLISMPLFSLSSQSIWLLWRWERDCFHLCYSLKYPSLVRLKEIYWTVDTSGWIYYCKLMGSCAKIAFFFPLTSRLIIGELYQGCLKSLTCSSFLTHSYIPISSGE